MSIVFWHLWVFPFYAGFFSLRLLNWFDAAKLGGLDVYLTHQIQSSNSCPVAFGLSIHEAGFAVKLLMPILHLKQLFG